MTIPTLVQGFQEKVTVSQVKQSFSLLNEAFKLSFIQNGTIDEWGITTLMNDPLTHKVVAKKLIPHLKLIKDCTDETDSETECSGGSNPQSFSTFTLANGTNVLVRLWDGACRIGETSNEADRFLPKHHVCGQLKIDINGTKKPNSRAKDQFDFYITTDGILPWGVENDRFKFEQSCNRTVANPYPTMVDGSMWGCTAWVIYTGNLDFWKCDNLSWSGKKSCSN